MRGVSVYQEEAAELSAKQAAEKLRAQQAEEAKQALEELKAEQAQVGRSGGRAGS